MFFIFVLVIFRDDIKKTESSKSMRGELKKTGQGEEVRPEVEMRESWR